MRKKDTPTHHKKETNEKETDRDLVNATIVLTIFTGIMAIGTFVLALYTVRMYNSTVDGFASADIRSQQEMRAYLVIKPHRPYGVTIDTIDWVPCVSVDIENIGKTPATVDSIYYLVYVDTVPPFIKTPQFDTSGIMPIIKVIGVSNPLEITQLHGHTANHEVCMDIIKGKKIIFFYMNVVYRDIFNNKYFTHTSSEYFWDDPKLNTLGRFNTIGTYNDAN